MVARSPVLLLLLLNLALGACTRLGFKSDNADHGSTEVDQAVLLDGSTDQAADQAADQTGDQASDPDAQTLPAEGIWTPTSTSPLTGRLWVTGAWTGKAFVVWGGAVVYPDYNGSTDGAIYDPVARTWTAMSQTGAPSARHTPSLVWDGGGLLVYGGAELYSPVGGGARYDPVSDTWTALSTSGSPNARIYHVAHWVKTQMFIWGGLGGGHHDDGRLYDPVADIWTPTTTTGAPSERSIMSSTWTGSEVLIWGGCDGAMGGCLGIKGDGARYRPDLDRWTPISSVGAPAARKAHTVVWAQNRMIVFGGCADANEKVTVPGNAAYDPLTDTWSAISTVGMPADRCMHAAAWLPGIGRMVVWGGAGGGNDLTDGGLYDPVADKWEPMSTVDAPAPRRRFAYAVSDRCLFVWGGRDPAGPLLATGAVWCGPSQP